MNMTNGEIFTVLLQFEEACFLFFSFHAQILSPTAFTEETPFNCGRNVEMIHILYITAKYFVQINDADARFNFFLIFTNQKNF